MGPPMATPSPAAAPASSSVAPEAFANAAWIDAVVVPARIVSKIMSPIFVPPNL